MQKGISSRELKMKWNKKKFLTLSVIAVVIISIVIVALTWTKNSAASSTGTSAQRTSTVKRGTIEVSITGSGTVTSSSTSDVMANVDGKITKAHFQEGDTVKKGELLYEIDDTDARLNIQKIENSISQAQLSSSSVAKSYSNLKITAPFNGKVTDVVAETGENVNNGMSLFTITETSKLKLSVPFSTSIAENIKAGQTAQVHVQEIMDSIDGTVTAIDDNAYLSSDGVQVRNVEITVPNPGTLTETMSASVDILTASGVESSNDIYKFEYANKKTVQASSSGTFSKVNIKNNQYVNKGDLLIEIENDDLQITSKSNELKLQDLNNQREAAQKNLENYKIYSSIDGTVTSVKAVGGDSVKTGSSLISIRDFKQMQFTISVDELDISKVQVGQEVSITVDALTETTADPLSGEVVYKAMEGTSSNGVATYDVTIKINNSENLLAGMNANATVILDKAEDSLIVPIEAVTQMGGRAFVWIKGSSDNSNGQTKPDMAAKDDVSNSAPAADSDSAKRGSRAGNASSSSDRKKMPARFAQNQEYYAGATMKEVKVGLTSEDYIEIKSGLAEGDVVILPPLAESSTGDSKSATQSGGFNLGGMGGISGGFPSGGDRMPSGGMPNGGGMLNGSGAQKGSDRQ